MEAKPDSLVVRDLHTYYGESYVLQGVNLRVPRASVVALLGRNGMGKTTLVRSIGNLTPPRRGEVTLDGRPITHLEPYQIARLGVALIPQGRRIFPSLSVLENLQLPVSSLARDRAEPARAGVWNLDAVLEIFPPLRDRLRNRGDALSGGEQQMLAIGRALMSNPRLILMDEPSEGLAPAVLDQIREVLLDLKRHDLAILLVEQHYDFAMRVADKVYVMTTGTIVFEGSPSELDAATEVQARHLGA